jgi:hypothetical protein
MSPGFDSIKAGKALGGRHARRDKKDRLSRLDQPAQSHMSFCRFGRAQSDICLRSLRHIDRLLDRDEPERLDETYVGREG